MCLKSFLEENPQCVNLVFPTEKEGIISCEEMKVKIQFQGDDLSEKTKKSKELFLMYIDHIESRKEGEIHVLQYLLTCQLAGITISFEKHTIYIIYCQYT